MAEPQKKANALEDKIAKIIEHLKTEHYQIQRAVNMLTSTTKAVEDGTLNVFRKRARLVRRRLRDVTSENWSAQDFTLIQGWDQLGDDLGQEYPVLSAAYGALTTLLNLLGEAVALRRSPELRVDSSRWDLFRLEATTWESDLSQLFEANRPTTDS